MDGCIERVLTRGNFLTTIRILQHIYGFIVTGDVVTMLDSMELDNNWVDLLSEL